MATSRKYPRWQQSRYRADRISYVAGPVLVVETIVFDFCRSQDWDYLSFRLWIGIWIGMGLENLFLRLSTEIWIDRRTVNLSHWL